MTEFSFLSETGLHWGRDSKMAIVPEVHVQGWVRPLTRGLSVENNA